MDAQVGLQEHGGESQQRQFLSVSDLLRCRSVPLVPLFTCPA